MPSQEIRHTVRFKASPEAIYTALMNSRAHAAFTGAPASVDPKVGGRFTAWGDYIEGINVELVKNRRIVQAWRANTWPEAHYSIVCFELRPAKAGTTLVFTQTGIPAKHAKGIDAGWGAYYWEPLKTYFSKGKQPATE